MSFPAQHHGHGASGAAPLRVCLCANTLYFPQGGGHRWVYLNWALGLRKLGCEVIWLELVAGNGSPHETLKHLEVLKSHLAPYGLAESVALAPWTDEPLTREVRANALGLDDISDSHLLLNFQYSISESIVRRFPRSVLVDIDPGLLQVWMSKGQLSIVHHDHYFTIGETVGQPGSSVPDVGIEWLYTPPCVALDWWPMVPAPTGAPFTTVTNWWASASLDDDTCSDTKGHGFRPFIDLPRRTTERLELAVRMGSEDQGWVSPEKQELSGHGWIVRDASWVSSTPRDYQQYIQASRGEFSCAKPACIRLENAWISDRTICYLASGKPAVVQHTGPSRFLPDAAGLFRFRSIKDAAGCLEQIADEYDHQCQLARSLAEEYFDATRVVRAVLNRVLN